MKKLHDIVLRSESIAFLNPTEITDKYYPYFELGSVLGIVTSGFVCDKLFGGRLYLTISITNMLIILYDTIALLIPSHYKSDYHLEGYLAVPLGFITTMNNFIYAFLVPIILSKEVKEDYMEHTGGMFEFSIVGTITGTMLFSTTFLLAFISTNLESLLNKAVLKEWQILIIVVCFLIIANILIYTRVLAELSTTKCCMNTRYGRMHRRQEKLRQMAKKAEIDSSYKGFDESVS
jgi:hypothetical protein